MKYEVDIEIDLPVNRVIELFDNEENMYKWMEGLQSIEQLSGTPGQVGAKSRISFLNGKRKMEMTETVLNRDLPRELAFSYEAKGVYNIVKNRFEELPGNRTRYVNDQEFQFKGFMKIIAFLMPGAFKKQSRKYLTLFKDFAEGEGSGT